MTKKDFIDAVSLASGLSKKETEASLSSFFDCLQDLLSKGDSITFPGFGGFSVKERAERNGRNPSTGNPIKIPASKAVAFKAGSGLKEAVNK